ncbi:MAG TPA: hypothetical protein VMZ91_01610, partial [Candidatus Paceibacterota bacterium]|nr:hypothetical protein [Candidatus Paceibacterota bacterium]
KLNSCVKGLNKNKNKPTQNPTHIEQCKKYESFRIPSKIFEDVIICVKPKQTKIKLSIRHL